MSDYLRARIAQRRHRLAEISRQIETLFDERQVAEAELRAYEDLLAHQLADGRPQLASIEHASHDMMLDLGRLSPIWRKVLFNVAARYPEPASLEDVRSVVRHTDPSIADETIRSQLSSYTSRGLLKRIGPSMYQAAPELHRVVSRYDISERR